MNYFIYFSETKQWVETDKATYESHNGKKQIGWTNMAYVSVDIDIDEVTSGMSHRELQQLADDLYDDRYVPTQIKAVTDDSTSVSDEEWNEVIEKLRTGKIFLTIEEEELIKQLAKKL